MDNDYDFTYTPMGFADKISKEHDMMQDREIAQPQGWLEDVRTLKSDKILLDRAESVSVLNDPTNSREDWLRTKNISIFFSAVVRYKEWKEKTMLEKGLDPTKAGDQLKVIFSDWHPTFLSKDWWAKRLLGASGGAASESQRNTVKPVAKKGP